MQKLIIIITHAILLAGLVILSLSCAPQTALEISVTELDNGVMIENVGDVYCLVLVNSPDGEQKLELAASQDKTVTGILQPIEVSAVSAR